MAGQLSVLTISEESLVTPIREAIREIDPEYTIDSANSSKQALIFLEHHIYDLIISQCTVGDFSGIALVKAMQGKGSVVPMILISEKTDEQNIIDALYRGLQCTILPASDRTYTIERIQHMIISILERKKQKEVFETNIAQLSGIISHMPDPTFAIDPEGRVIFRNKAIEKASGVRAVDVLGKGDYEYATPIYGKRRPTCIDLVTAPNAEREAEYHNSVRTGNQISIEYAPAEIDGQKYYVELHASPGYDSLGKITGAVESITDITALKLVEEALRKSEAEFRGITERISDLIMSMDSEGVITYVSPSVKPILGYEPEFLRGKRPEDFLMPQDLEQVHDSIEKVKQGEPVKRLEIRLRKKDGTCVVIEMAGAPIFENTIFTGMQVVGRDITEKKIAENHISQLLDEQKELLGIINNSPSVVFLWKAEGNWPVERVTENVSLFGYTVNDFLSGDVTIKSMTHPDDWERIFAEILHNAAHHVDDFVQAYRIIGTDGTVHWVEDFTHIRRDGHGGVTHYQGVINDITQRKRGEEALSESQAHYRQLFESSPVSLWEVDLSTIKLFLNELRATGITHFRRYFDEHPEETVRFCSMVAIQNVNNATLHLLDVNSKDELKANFEQAKTDETRIICREGLIALAQGELSYTGENSYNTFSGKNIRVIFQMVVIPGYEQTLEKILISLLDITDRKKAEAALQQVNEKINLLGSITRHDILNQVTAVQGYMEILDLKRLFPPGSKEENYITNISCAADTIKQQILFTRDYQDLGKKAPTWYRVSRIIDQNSCNPMFREIRVVNFVRDLTIYADPMVTKVIYNLLDNAVKHGVTTNTMIFSCVQSENQAGVDLICEDNGLGVFDPVKQKIFTRGSYKDSGFGLFLSREILSVTGLSIEENGVVGKGARFVIHIPKGMFRFGEG